MKKKTKKVTKPVRKNGTRLIGQVHVQYVQVQVPESMIAGTVEALSQLLLSDYHRQFCTFKESDEY